MSKQTVRRSLSLLAATCLAVGAAGVATIPAAHAAAGDASMVPTNLTRIVDTREKVGLAATLADNDVKDIQITGEVDTVAGDKKAKATIVPAKAEAVVLNMTAVDAKDPGYFVAWKAGTARPATSNINFMKGDTIANGATVPLSADGKISVFSRGSADILLDIAGYYAEGKYVATGTPQRLFDSDLSPEGPVKARSITRIKAGDAGDLVTLNITVDQPQGAGYLTAWETEETVNATTPPSILGMPQTSNLNYEKGQTVSNTVEVIAGTGGYVSIYSMEGARLVVDRVSKVASGDVADVAKLLKPAKRIMDTRSNIGSDKKTGYRDFNLLDQAETSAEKNKVSAAIVNVTVANPKADGFIAIGPNLEANGPNTSVLNFKAGQVVANRVIIPANFAGKLQAYSNVETDLILDVMGYTYVPTALAADAAAAELDLSKAESTTVFTGEALANLNKKSAIGLPVGLDGMVIGTDKWMLKGTSVKVKDSAGKESTVALVDHVDEAKGKVDYKLVPLSSFSEGTYTLTADLEKFGSSPVAKATYEAQFSIANLSPQGAAHSTTKEWTVTQMAVVGGKATVLTVDGTDVSFNSGDSTTNTAASAKTAINGNTTLSAAGITADNTDGVLEITKQGGEAAAVSVKTAGDDKVSLSTGIDITLAVANAAKSVDSVLTIEGTDVTVAQTQNNATTTATTAATNINGNATLQAAGIRAVANAAVLTITKPGNAAPSVTIKEEDTGNAVVSATTTTKYNFAQLGSTAGTNDLILSLDGTSHTVSSGTDADATATAVEAKIDDAPYATSTVATNVVTVIKSFGEGAAISAPAMSITTAGGNAVTTTADDPKVYTSKDAGTNYTTAKLPIADKAESTKKTVFAAPADAPMVWSTQKLKVKLPSGFDIAGAFDGVVYKAGDKTAKALSGQTFGGNNVVLTPPSRSDYMTEKIDIPNKLMVTISSADAATNADKTHEVEFELKLK